MKRIATIALLFAATFFVSASAIAQDHRTKATVPFNFQVGTQTLPAGTYMIGSQSSNPALLSIYSREQGIHTYTLGQPDQSYNPQPNVLVFHNYGGEYYLSEIRSQDSALNIHFRPSKAEKRARAATEEAGQFRNDPVLIALN